MENKYLEKIAGWAQNMGGWMGNIKTLPHGGGAVSSTFNALDQMVGKGFRTVQKATQSKLPTDMVGVGAGKEFFSKVKKTSLVGNRSALSGKATNPVGQLPQGYKDQLKANRQAAFKDLRERMGRVKDPSGHAQSTIGGKIEGRVQGYEAPGARFDPDAKNKYLEKSLKTADKNQRNNNRIGTARAKVGLAAAGVAGTAGLGYHMANKKNEADLNAQYGNMPY